MKSRRYIRHPSTIPIEYVLQPDQAPRRDALQDVSYGGLSFSSREPLEIGQRLTLQIPTIRDDLELEAVVVWRRKHDAQYLVGVTFLNQHDGYTMRMVEQICHIEAYRQQAERQGRHLTSRQAAQEWINRYAEDFPELAPRRANGA